jgi:hypothetical protein
VLTVGLQFMEILGDCVNLEVGPIGRELGHWGCALEESFGSQLSLSVSLFPNCHDVNRPPLRHASVTMC